MSFDIQIKCRLDDLMDEKDITPEELAMASGVSEMKIKQYRNGALESASISEIASIMAVIGCGDIGELLDVSVQDVPVENDVTDYDRDTPILYEIDWDSRCPDVRDGKHRWYKDMHVSDSIYQEFVCKSCRKRLAVIL